MARFAVLLSLVSGLGAVAVTPCDNDGDCYQVLQPPIGSLLLALLFLSVCR